MAIILEEPKKSKKGYLRYFGRTTVRQLKWNFVTQRIWPTEVYPGYAAINAKKGEHEWKSTGKGAKSFEFEVMSSEDGNETVRFQFNDYLRFVDMGVGAGTKIGDVETGKKAKYQKRYIQIWDRARGKSHRPAIMMEMRHAQGRLGLFLQNFYGREAQVYMYSALSGMHAIRIDV